MKKFFSILCAIAIAFGANAAQVSKKDVLAGKVAKKEIRSKQASTHVLKSTSFKSFDNNAASVAKVAPKNHVNAGKAIAGAEGKMAVKPVVLKTPQAKKEVFNYDLNSANADVDWSDNCADAGWWQIEAEDEDVYWSISNMDREVAAGEYAWEDLDPEYTCVYTSDFVYFTDGSCTVTVDDSEGLKVVVEGSFTGEDGNTYNVKIAYGEAAIVPGDYDFVAVKESHTYYSSDNDVYYKFADADDNMIYLDIVLGDTTLNDVELGKIYTLDDMLANYTKVDFDGKVGNLTEVSFVKTLDGASEKYEATATDEFGRIFHVTYSFKAPEAENFETITAEATITKEAFWFWYNYIIEAADEANAIVLEIMPDDSYFGTWEAGKDITGAVTPLNGLASEIYSGEVTIEQTADGCAITGKVLCMNNTEYTLNLTYTKPGPTREEVLMVDGLELAVYATAWQLLGYNEDSTKFVSIAANYSETITGNYTDADLLADYTYVVTDIEGSNYKEFELLSADLSVQFTEEDSTIIIAGNLVGQNGEDIPQFTVLLKGKIPAPEVSDMTFQFSQDEEGITVTPSNDEDAWDWYVVDEELFEDYGADGIAEAVYGNYGNYYAVTGEQTLTFAEDLAYYTPEAGVYYLVVWGAGSTNITTPAASYQFEVEEGSGSPYDAEEDFNIDFAEYDVDAQYAESYGVLFIEASNDDNDYISIELWLPEGATELTAGTYTVSAEEGEPATVTACYIDQYIYGSFAGSLTSDGNINIPFWFFTEGEVTVQEDGVILVDVVNTKGAAIKSQLGIGTAVDNINADAVASKRLENATLIIEKNGVRYNVLGSVVK